MQKRDAFVTFNAEKEVGMAKASGRVTPRHLESLFHRRVLVVLENKRESPPNLTFDSR
jgi:hypothetical protein